MLKPYCSRGSGLNRLTRQPIQGLLDTCQSHVMTENDGMAKAFDGKIGYVSSSQDLSVFN